jgi:hypothetical protein
VYQIFRKSVIDQAYFSDDEGGFGFMTTLSEPLQVLSPLECL